MTIILRKDFVISGTYKLTQDMEVASGVKVTILPGAVFDLGDKTLTNFGSIILSGSGNSFATIKSGVYSTKSTEGKFESTNGKLSNLNIDGFFSNGSLDLKNSFIQNSKIDLLSVNNISGSLFDSSSLNLNVQNAIISNSTFIKSPIEQYAWFNYPGVKINSSNFIGDGILINLSSFFSGTHQLEISNSYMKIASGLNFDDYIYDSDDTLKVTTDINASSFTSIPYSNSSKGFSAGLKTITWNELGINLLKGTSQSDIFEGGDGNQTILGYGGDDYLQGGVGKDEIDGGNGIDTADYSDKIKAVKVILNKSTNATVYVNAVAEDTIKNIENITGGSGADLLTGDSLANTLIGNGGDDALYGGSGADSITGGLGADILLGGAGDKAADIFDFNIKTESATGKARDKIFDFVSGTDKIDLSGIDANTAKAKTGDQAFLFNTTTAKANSVWYKVADVDGDKKANDLIIYGDVDGNTTADFEIGIVGVTAIASGDFVL